jgi:trehalose/maltose hydrolase-like predicted phosphorylase
MQYSESSPSLERQELPPESQTRNTGPATRMGESAALVQPTQDPRWLWVDEGFMLAREHEIESLFAIANGYIGNRGSLAEGSPLSAPATFAAGVFETEDKPGAVPGYLVLPDWTEVRAWIEGEPLSLNRGRILEHRRILDMRRGIFFREWIHHNESGRITRIASFRLASLADRHLLVQSVVIAPENYTGEVRLEAAIELPPECQSSPPPESWKTRRNGMRHNILPLALKSTTRDIVIAFAAASQLVNTDGSECTRDIAITDRGITERFNFNVEIGREYRLDRLVSIYTSRDVSEPRDAALVHVNRFFPSAVRDAVAAHEQAWERRWNDSGIELDGDDSLQRALHFAVYHLISAANPEDDRVSIGARALTGESYKGHVFWDTEIYMVPFYTFTHPASARALLMYRYHTLPAARDKAKTHNYRGAMYPWEAADTGEETTPRFVIDLNGKVIEVLNGEMEVHISGDVAFAVWQYWQATRDENFLLEAGAEIILETARFWASRGHFEHKGVFHIRGVIGPDEYHENIDDSAFTNLIAAWNLRRAIEVAQMLQARWPKRWQELAREIEFSADELTNWQRIADNMYLAFDEKTKLFEQFRGYYQLEPVDLLSYEPRNTAMDVILGHERIQHTNIVKQADVVMAMYMFWDVFPDEVRRANFQYYEPRTGHGSSLSPSIHALVAARFGEMNLAARYLKMACEIDLGNNMGNAAGGVHAAAIGGLWQAIVMGFAGFQAREDVLTFDPHLLPHWRRLAFPLEYRGRKLRIAMHPNEVHVEMTHGSDGLRIVLGKGKEMRVREGQHYVSRRTHDSWNHWEEARAA